MPLDRREPVSLRVLFLSVLAGIVMGSVAVTMLYYFDPPKTHQTQPR